MKYSKYGVVLVTTFNLGDKFPLRLGSQKPISPRHHIPPQSDHENYGRTKLLETLCFEHLSDRALRSLARLSPIICFTIIGQ